MPVDIYDISVPLLTGEDNLETWKTILLNALEAKGLQDYVLENVPQPTDAAQAKIWHQERALTRHILVTSLMEPRIVSLLKNNGWQMTEKDPKATFDLVERTIPTVGRINAARMFQEFVQLRRPQFDSMHAYVHRLTTLKTRLASLDCAIPEVGLVSVLLAGVRDSYPSEYNRWCREFEDKELSWESFIRELTRIGNTERGDLRLPLVETNKIKPSNQSRSTSTNGNNNLSEKRRKERTVCTICNKQSWTGLIHHDKCGKHIPKGGQCYWCEPEIAPSNWKHKEDAMKAKASTSTTAAISNNTNGLMTPSSTTPSTNLLFTGNLAILDHTPALPSPQDFY